MSSTRSWALALLRRNERATLDAALLTGRGARYVASRVSIVGVRAILRTVVHAAEIAILSRDFPFEFLTPLFAMRALPALVCSSAGERLGPPRRPAPLRKPRPRHPPVTPVC